MKKTVMGILAHVDSGKTTLSEALLYCAGQIRSIGRVDHRDAFLDTNKVEKERGITVFSKQAVLNDGDCSFTLIDTPGHVDFSSETERALWPLDCAVMVISAPEGIQSHTQTLWKLLSVRDIPIFIFVNKMDIACTGKEEILKSLNENFGDGFVDFGSDNFYEDIALCSEDMMQQFIKEDTVSDLVIKENIAQKRVFPCYFGSALKNSGVDKLWEGLKKYAPENMKRDTFGARLYKITTDERGERLSHLKITGGTLKPKDVILNEKVNEIRIYSGAKYKTVPIVHQGDVCAVTGLSETYGGQGIGFEADSPTPMLESVYSYRVVIKDGTDVRVALAKLKKLEEEDSQMRVEYNDTLREINITLMGEMQLEILSGIIKERFGIHAELEESGIVYKETIVSPAEGVGHYEPLRHYAEVHLLLEPLPQSSGLVFESDCSTLDLNRQRLVLTHLKEREHKGVLTGSPITDMKITLKSGRAHLKHTEGGDFRQATYRAVRHGLRSAQCKLLEPYYSFRLEVPLENTGRAMTDLQNRGADMLAPYTSENMTVIEGSVPVRTLRGYQSEINSYTHGMGKLTYSFKNYSDCLDSEKIQKEIGYNCDADVLNTADSVFCSHGAGFNVRWDKVTEYMHLESIFKEKSEEIKPTVLRKAPIVYDEDELIRIFERTYGKIVHKNHNALKTPKAVRETKKVRSAPPKKGKQYLIIDGYNIIFSWDALKKIAGGSLEDARAMLIDYVCRYKILNPYEIILVFDAYKVKGNRGEVETEGNVSIVYTKEAQTADSYIEKTAHELSRDNRVCVATSDNLEQMIILGSGAERKSASSFIKELEEAEREIEELIEEYGD